MNVEKFWNIIREVESLEWRERPHAIRRMIATEPDEALVLFEYHCYRARRLLAASGIAIALYQLFPGELNDSLISDSCARVILAGRNAFSEVLVDCDSILSHVSWEELSEELLPNFFGIGRLALGERLGEVEAEVLFKAVLGELGCVEVSCPWFRVAPYAEISLAAAGELSADYRKYIMPKVCRG